jgi:hypothetical protein
MPCFLEAKRVLESGSIGEPIAVHVEVGAIFDGRMPYFPCLMKSATRSPIIIAVTLVLARGQSGMIEASTTRRPPRPWTFPY